MPNRGIRKSSRRLRFLLGIVLVYSGILFCFVNGASWAQAGESVKGEAAAQDMDHHEHAEGAVEAMIPHQRHMGPHMKWTALRPANAGDAQRADQIVHALRQGLAKYKDYRVAMDNGYVPLHPEGTPRHYHFAK